MSPIQLAPVTRDQMPKLRRLYQTAFPLKERRPLWIIKSRGSLQCEFLALSRKENFLGFAIVQLWRDLVHIDFIAVAAEARGQGIGGIFLNRLKERYPNARIVLELEGQDDAAPNALQRKRRLDFYLRNGYRKTKFLQRVCGDRLDVMILDNRPLEKQELDRLLRLSFGPLFSFLSGTRILCRQD